MNQQLLACCSSLSQAQCEQPTHSFFSSIITYWNHLLFGDLIMLNRIVSSRIGDIQPQILAECPVAKSTTDTYCLTIKDITALRTQVDEVIGEIINRLSDDHLIQLVRYKTTEGDDVSARLSDVLQHMFNHQTHHRGQLTCVLSQLNVDFGCTDLPVIVPEMKTFK